jgi:signal peptidase I
MTTNKAHGFFELVKTVVYAVIIALFVRTFLFEPFSIPSGSMIPTLLVGDYLFVSKYSFGYSRYSLPLSLPLFEGRIWSAPPERGDVVVFKLPADNSTDYIKRVIGLPGDRIQIKGGVVHINDEAVRRELVPATNPRRFAEGSAVASQRYVEILPNGRRHLIQELTDGGAWDNTGVYLVPADHYFVLGDNRDSSRDSRFLEVGYVPFVNLIGRAERIFFSVDGNALSFWLWYRTVRFDRLFLRIE